MFDVDLDAYPASNGHVIAEQGEPPDFVLEVASASTGRIDVGDKRDDYLAFGIPKYWCLDETGEFHGARLAGDHHRTAPASPLEVTGIRSSVPRDLPERQRATLATSS